jgi:hypothetical protein
MTNPNTSIGRGPASGGNENHDGDATKTTLGETVSNEKPAGVGPVVDKEKIDKAYPDGPNVEASPWELDAARGKPHQPGKD